MARPEHDSEYGSLFSEAYVANTDEKERLCQLLESRFRDERFGSFLDVGAGDGIVTEVFERRSKRAVAVETQPDYCEALRKRLPSAEIISGTIMNVEFERSSFEAILCSHMLYYVPLHLWRDLIMKMHSWVAPGGKLVIVLNSADTDWFRYVVELSGTLKILPGFSFCDPEQAFVDIDGGPDEFLPYESTFDFKGSKDDLREFLLNLFMLLPKELISDEHRKSIDRFIESKCRSGGLKMNNKSVVCIWNKG